MALRSRPGCHMTKHRKGARIWSLKLDGESYSVARRVQARLVLLDNAAVPLVDVVAEAIRAMERAVEARAGQAAALRGDGRGDAASRAK